MKVGSVIARLGLNPGNAAAIAARQLCGGAGRHSFAALMGDPTELLEARVAPRVAHAYPKPARTPLMLAAENDLPELFALMLRQRTIHFARTRCERTAGTMSMFFLAGRVMQSRLTQTTSAANRSHSAGAR